MKVSRDYTNRLNFNTAMKRLNKSDIFCLTVFKKKTLTECESVVITTECCHKNCGT